jgi:hypothetical protein
MCTLDVTLKARITAELVKVNMEIRYLRRELKWFQTKPWYPNAIAEFQSDLRREMEHRRALREMLRRV